MDDMRSLGRVDVAGRVAQEPSVVKVVQELEVGKWKLRFFSATPRIGAVEAG